MKRFQHGQRVQVTKDEGGRPVNAVGSVVRLRMADNAAWVRLDARLSDDAAHPFPADDSRGTDVVAWPSDCSEVVAERERREEGAGK